MTLPAHTVMTISARYLLVFVISLLASSAQANPKPGSNCVFWDKDGDQYQASGSSSNGSDRTANGWVTEPNMRGSTTIVTTCLITLGLCVWTSIHVDVEYKTHPPLIRLWRKARISLKALLLPNLVVQASYEQCTKMERLYEALANVQYIHMKMTESGAQPAAQAAPGGWKTLKRLMKKSVGLNLKDEDTNSNYPFSKEVAFFVVMRGFVRPPKTEGPPKTPDQKKQRKDEIITPEDFFNAYARNPEAFRKMIKEKEILDKGNASNIAKLIILAQVAKLVLQMIGRKAQGLSVALLELHIFVHILIAGLLYSYWWYKQLDVNVPIELNIGDRYWTPDPMWSYYPEQALKSKGFEGFKQYWQPSRRFSIGIRDPGPPPAEWVGCGPKDKSGMRDMAEMRAMAPADYWREAVRQIDAMRFVDVDQGKDEDMNEDQTSKPKLDKLPPAALLYPPNPPATSGQQTSPGQETQPSMASQEITHTPSVPAVQPNHTMLRDGRAFSPSKRRVKNETKLKRGKRACTFYVIYAGLHTTVWNEDYFPTVEDKWIWRGACIGIAGVPVLLVVLGWVKSLWTTYREEHEGGGVDLESQEGQAEEAKGNESKWLERLRRLFTLKGFLEVVYLFASIALLGESFAALRAEDADTYRIRSWTAFLRVGG